MISLITAKLFLFIALCLGPKDASTFLITSDSGNCVWTQEAHGWNLDEKYLPTHAWPANGLDVSTQDLNDVRWENASAVRRILHHSWKTDSVLMLDNGDRLEKRGTKIFYTVNPGAANQKVYTIYGVENDIPL